MANIKSINGNPIVVNTSGIEDGAVTTDKLDDNAVIGDKINDLAVRTSKLANNAVTSEKIAPNTITYADISVTGTDRIHQDNINDDAVNTRVIANNAVTKVKLADNSVTYEKLPITGSLIEALKDRRITYNIEFEQGRIDQNTGDEVASSTQIRSAKIAFHNGAKIIFKTNNVGAHVVIHKYTANNSYIGNDLLDTFNAAAGYRADYIVSSPIVRIAIANGAYSNVQPSFADNFTIYQPYEDFTDVVRKEFQGKTFAIDPAWQNNGIGISTGADVSSSTQCRTAYIPIGNETRLFDVTFRDSSESPYWFVAYYDENKTFISSTEAIQSGDTVETAEGAYYLRMVLSYGQNTTAEDGKRVAISFLPKTKWYGKRYSVLGDSLSTYDGISPSDGAANAFYPKGNVNRPARTWWYRVGRMLGMTLDTCNAYSSSIVTGPSVYTSMSSDERLSNLGNPDLVLFCGGTNDIYSGANIGSWRGYDVENLENYVNEFIAAYTRCISYIQSEYGCKVLSITPSFVIAEGHSGRQNMTIENLESFCNAINTVCGYMGVEVIDSRKLVMNIHNVSDYTIDELHWGVTFTMPLAQKIYNVLVG